MAGTAAHTTAAHSPCPTIRRPEAYPLPSRAKNSQAPGSHLLVHSSNRPHSQAGPRQETQVTPLAPPMWTLPAASQGLRSRKPEPEPETESDSVSAGAEAVGKGRAEKSCWAACQTLGGHPRAPPVLVPVSRCS